jgi:hypothetical protein
MKSQIVAVLFSAAMVVSPIAVALAQGGGGSGGGSGGANGSASGGATSGTTTATGGGMQQATPQSSKAQAIQRQKDAATTGSETAPSQPGEGAVGGPGVGVGHSANGKPIGAPGSGLGSQKIRLMSGNSLQAAGCTPCSPLVQAISLPQSQ